MQEICPFPVISLISLMLLFLAALSSCLCGAVCCGMMQRCVVRCTTLQCVVVCCRVVQFGVAVWCSGSTLTHTM